MSGLAHALGGWLAHYLNQPVKHYVPFAVHGRGVLTAVIEPGDILLVEGNLRISTAIKYLTQSTWSHACLYVGDCLGERSADGEPKVLIEADLIDGVQAVPLSTYTGLNVRICRAVGLTAEDKRRVIAFFIDSLGKRYDLRNVFDLARYLLPEPPVPTGFRRRMLSLGSGDPTRAICSTLIAQAFQSVDYPILPEPDEHHPGALTKRHHSFFAPRDFDLSPYFEVIKPTIEQGFEYRTIVWADETSEQPEATS